MTMLKSEIEVGGLYTAKVNGKVTVVRVDVIRKIKTYQRGRLGSGEPGNATVYDVTNTATGKRTTFRSAQRFLGRAKPAAARPAKAKAEPIHPDDRTSKAGKCKRCGLRLVIWDG